MQRVAAVNTLCLFVVFFLLLFFDLDTYMHSSERISEAYLGRIGQLP